MIKIADLPYTLEKGTQFSHSVPCFNGSFTYFYEVVDVVQRDEDHNDVITLVSMEEGIIHPMDVEPAWFLNRKVVFKKSFA